MHAACVGLCLCLCGGCTPLSRRHSCELRLWRLVAVLAASAASGSGTCAAARCTLGPELGTAGGWLTTPFYTAEHISHLTTSRLSRRLLYWLCTTHRLCTVYFIELLFARAIICVM